NVLDRHRLDLSISSNHVGLRGDKTQQSIESIGRSATTAHFHPVAEQHKGYKHRCRIIARFYLRSKEGGKDAEEVGYQNAQAHQHIHIQGTITQSTQCPRMKHPPSPPNNRRGKYQQDPVWTDTKGRRQVYLQEVHTQWR